MLHQLSILLNSVSMPYDISQFAKIGIFKIREQNKKVQKWILSTGEQIRTSRLNVPLNGFWFVEPQKTRYRRATESGHITLGDLANVSQKRSQNPEKLF